MQYASNVAGKSTEGLFDGLNIMGTDERYLRQHRKYPVIFLTFKDIKSLTYETAYDNVQHLMSGLYAEHRHNLQTSQ